MPPAQAPNPMYCAPNDVFDYLAVEGAELRLDDQQLATGQTIQATADAVVGATSLTVAPLQYPLLRGSVLQFDGGGTTQVIPAVLTAAALVGSTTLAVVALTTAINATAQATDSGVNTATAARLAKGCYYGTSTVNDYCLNRYDAPVLATSWTVNRWASVLAGKWVASRRGNAVPKSIQEDAKEAMQELKAVRTGLMNIGGLGTRTSGWPFLSNIRLDLAYTYAKLRVEAPISEGTPTQYPQFVDWNSLFLIEF